MKKFFSILCAIAMVFSANAAEQAKKDMVNLTFSTAVGDEVEWYDYTAITGLWQIEADGDEAYIIIGNATESEQAAGSYAWSDLDPEYCGVYLYALDSAVQFTAGSCIITVEETTDTLKVVVAGAFTGDNGNIYNVSITYMEAPLPEPTRQASLTMTGLELEVYEGTWLLSGYNADSTTYVRLAAFGNVISGEYTAYNVELDFSYIATDITADSSNRFDLLDADLLAVFNETDNTIVVTGTILGMNGDDVPEFTVNLSGQIADPSGIENIVLTEQAQKVLMDGAVYIIRDNKLFNVLGSQVR